eukprot:2089047-Prymnesium_polylepis.2
MPPCDYPGSCCRRAPPAGPFVQADVVMLSYPLMLPMDAEVRRSDLGFYAGEGARARARWGMRGDSRGAMQR